MARRTSERGRRGAARCRPPRCLDHHHVIDDDDLACNATRSQAWRVDSLINGPAPAGNDGGPRPAPRWDEVVGAGRLLFVYGGDCSMLLGIVTGLYAVTCGGVGLPCSSTGAEDTMPLDVSKDGEAASARSGCCSVDRPAAADGELGLIACPRCGPKSW